MENKEIYNRRTGKLDLTQLNNFSTDDFVGLRDYKSLCCLTDAEVVAVDRMIKYGTYVEQKGMHQIN